MDTELKREYQPFLQAPNRGRSKTDGRPKRSQEEIREWVEAHHLPIGRNHVQFPDVRIEYERPDGTRPHEDLQLSTGHYNSRQMAAKRASGFTMHHTSGSRLKGAQNSQRRPPLRHARRREHTPMTNDERAASVQAFGFTPRQAGFLTTVMLHSGVCVRRQYATFIRITPNSQVVRDFFLLLLDRRFARAYECDKTAGRIYHIQHKALYQAVGEPDNRNRRAITIARATQRLMLLDAILSTPDLVWLATERDKVDFFVHRCGVGATEFPALTFERSGSRTVRYFPDKLPIGNRHLSNEVVFTYIASSADTAAFVEFLDRHRALLLRLNRWVLLLVLPQFLAGAQSMFANAFHRFAAPPLRLNLVEELKWFCQTRRSLEQHQRRPAGPDAERYAAARRAFRAPHFYSVYRKWLRSGDAAFNELLSGAFYDRFHRGDIRLEFHVLPHQYHQLAPTIRTA